MKCAAFALMLASAALQAWSRDVERLPLREIDRALILPKGMWQECLTWNAGSYGDTLMDMETTQIVGFLPALPSWSITDRLSMISFPWPFIRYLILGENIGTGSEGSMHNLGIAIDGGVTSIAYDEKRGWEYFGALGANFKKPLTKRLWAQGRVHFFAGNYFGKLEGAGTSSLGAGIQWSTRFYSITSYSFYQAFRPDFGRMHAFDRRIHAFDQEVGVNFTPVLSLSYGFNLDSDDYTSVRLQLAIQW
ncbi:MAG TPA: hypothetical protein VJ385_01085 [Fibrobacteria bacterium]|nr:hypothetical protein [Fibrobacteria bacterium]